jgi:RNA polymerase sigma factor (sigma-70 family)
MPTEQDIERMVTENTGLIRHLVGRTSRLFSRLPGGFEREDLESFGYMGLVRAARTYDPTRGVAFSTYAYKCIENAIRGELERAHSHQSDGQGRTVECISINILIGEDEDTQLEDQIRDTGLDAEELVINRSNTTMLQAAVERLPPEQCQIIWDVYFNQMSLAEVAQKMRRSPQRIQVLHSKALKMLRRSLRHER